MTEMTREEKKAARKAAKAAEKAERKRKSFDPATEELPSGREEELALELGALNAQPTARVKQVGPPPGGDMPAPAKPMPKAEANAIRDKAIDLGKGALGIFDLRFKDDDDNVYFLERVGGDAYELRLRPLKL